MSCRYYDILAIFKDLKMWREYIRSAVVELDFGSGTGVTRVSTSYQVTLVETQSVMHHKLFYESNELTHCWPVLINCPCAHWLFQALEPAKQAYGTPE